MSEKPISAYSEESRRPLPKQRKGKVSVCANIGLELHRLCQENNIGWTEALRRGATLMLSEKGDPLYQNPKQQQQRIDQLLEEMTNMREKVQQLEENNQ